MSDYFPLHKRLKAPEKTQLLSSILTPNKKTQKVILKINRKNYSNFYCIF